MLELPFALVSLHPADGPHTLELQPSITNEHGYKMSRVLAGQECGMRVPIAHALHVVCM